MRSYDEALQYLGDTSSYHRRVIFALSLVSIQGAVNVYIAVFAVSLPDHRCAIPGLANDTYAVQNEAHQWFINESIPLAQGKTYPYERCKLWVEDSNGNVSFGNRSESGCDRWVFDKEVFQTTATEQMSLVCDNLIRRSHLNMLFQGGVMFGAITLGTMADIFGRQKMLCFSLTCSLLVGIATVWVPEFISFCFFRFVLGALGSGFFLNAFTLSVELVGPSKRMRTGMIIQVTFAVGLFVLAFMSYFIRDWRNLQLAISVPSVIFISYWWLIPESPRWLISKGRTEEAEKVIRQAANVNNVTIPDKVFDRNGEEENSSLQKVKLIELFVHPTLLVRTLVIFLNWCVVSMAYFGLSLSSGYLYGGIHLNFFLSSAVEFIGTLLCFPLLDRIGRKALFIICMIVGGVACCSTIFTLLYLPEEHQAVTTALAMVGKLGVSAAFCIAFIYSSELFPTVVRNAGMGMSSTSARVGSMASPYIADLGVLIGGKFGTALPLMIFGILSVLSGLASLLLPETVGRKLPETIEEAINFKNQKREDKPDEKKMGNQEGIEGSVRTVKYTNPALEAEDGL